MDNLMKRLGDLDRKLTNREIEVECAFREFKEAKKKVRELKQEKLEAEEALRVLRQAGQGVRKKLFRRLSDTVSYALKDIFGENTYRFVVESKFTGKKVSIEFPLKKGRRVFDPLESCGHGIADVISFALRVALLAMKSAPKRAVLLLDEPFRNVSNEYKERVGMFLRKVCKETGIQIIMCTHIPEFINAADRVFIINKAANGKTVVRMKEEVVNEKNAD